MSGHGPDDIEHARRYKTPYSAKHPIPTIAKYRREKESRQQNALDQDDVDNSNHDQSYEEGHDPNQDDGSGAQNQGDDNTLEDTSQIDPGAADVKKRRKEMKHNKQERAEREVTDPVTHLPIVVHDFTDKALKDVDLNEPPFGSTGKTATGLSGKKKSDEQLDEEKVDVQQGHNFLVNRFPPPDFDALRQELVSINKTGITFALAGSAIIIVGAVLLDKIIRRDGFFDRDDGKFHLSTAATWLVVISFSVGGLAMLVISVRDWISKKVNGVFQDEVWDAQRRQIKSDAARHENETTAWLNSLLGSVWPLVNPDLFAGLADMLEDVMQASLPRFVRMVSVEDIGQGSESLRILGVRWLPTGAATKSVTEDGDLTVDNQDEADTNEQCNGKSQKDSGSDKQGADGKAVAEGMEAEEGEFVNLEIAFAYRTRSTSKTLKERTKDMHLYLAFYLPGNIKVPVWVDLQGVIGTMRMRLQLTPDPPFFQLATITFLGQPKVDLSCVPLSKHALNIMDVPMISNFVQSSVDAAMAEYVAPKSLTLDLKDMLVGDDFKKDTNAKGILVVNIRRGYDFKVADTGIPLIKEGSSDPYVSVGWAKFGKVLWSTRILTSEMEPAWDEVCYVLVTPQELNVDERLRLQLWDSDRLTADDDLGRIEVDLKQIMKSEESNGKMWHRTDGFRALKSGDNMPGKLEWSIGYFSKARLQECQFEKQTHDPQIRNRDQLQKKVTESCERKLRETMFKEGRSERDESEMEQQKHQELKDEEDAMIISAPPPENYPSGIFSLQIHNITGLEVEKLSKDENDSDNKEEEESGEGLPSAYCTIIINHKKQFKTRTKPQNAKPFYNAGCERFVGDWRDCEVMVSVRDARIDEEDPLLGMVYLPLNEIFKERSQVMGFWPLTGGVGYGRIRLSMVWRSLQLEAPPNMLGWDYGTLDIEPWATVADETKLPQDPKSAKLKFRTNLSSGKMYYNKEQGKWTAKRDRNLKLAVHRRYSSCLSIALKHKGKLGESVSAFCVLWLKDLVDEEAKELELPIWKGDFKRATACCLDEPGEKLGLLKLKLTFWAGLGGAHSKWISKDQNLREVAEVIDTARDNLEADQKEKEAGIVDAGEDTSDRSSDEDSSDDDDVKGGSNGNKQGPVDQFRDYKRRERGLHRKHRGIMQWKIPRTAKWAKHKVEQVGGLGKGIVQRHSEGGGIETEV
ncbi:hypothetical protein NLU13_8236 [Sarocladium strictum]|uniref:Meiotically up-regulated gene 190 protein n=1 Tax=Sarocladium strictum TaxID=5046 RepID=A0AA39GDL9_SARSR|nr:hypothetical protein NLU13_8236 [Sarocladium strictum]